MSLNPSDPSSTVRHINKTKNLSKDKFVKGNSHLELHKKEIAHDTNDHLNTQNMINEVKGNKENIKDENVPIKKNIVGMKNKNKQEFKPHLNSEKKDNLNHEKLVKKNVVDKNIIQGHHKGVTKENLKNEIPVSNLPNDIILTPKHNEEEIKDNLKQEIPTQHAGGVKDHVQFFSTKNLEEKDHLQGNLHKSREFDLNKKLLEKEDNFNHNIITTTHAKPIIKNTGQKINVKPIINQTHQQSGSGEKIANESLLSNQPVLEKKTDENVQHSGDTVKHLKDIYETLPTHSQNIEPKINKTNQHAGIKEKITNEALLTNQPTIEKKTKQSLKEAGIKEKITNEALLTNQPILEKNTKKNLKQAVVKEKITNEALLTNQPIIENKTNQSHQQTRDTVKHIKDIYETLPTHSQNINEPIINQSQQQSGKGEKLTSETVLNQRPVLEKKINKSLQDGEDTPEQLKNIYQTLPTCIQNIIHQSSLERVEGIKDEKLQNEIFPIKENIQGSTINQPSLKHTGGTEEHTGRNVGLISNIYETNNQHIQGTTEFQQNKSHEKSLDNKELFPTHQHMQDLIKSLEEFNKRENENK